MRTTLDIDDDVLQAAKELSRRKRRSVGQVVSELARESLTRSTPANVAKESRGFYGFHPLPRVPGKIVTNEMIDPLREDESE